MMTMTKQKVEGGSVRQAATNLWLTALNQLQLTYRPNRRRELVLTAA
jgi:hypothetical protein